MDRLKKFNMRTALVIFAFSLLLTAAFTGALFWFSSSANTKITSNNGIYLLSKTDYTQIIENNGTINIDRTKLIGEENYYSQYIDYLLSMLLPISIVFLFILFLLSLCLWFILRKIQDKETLKIAYELNFAVDNNISSSNSALSFAYEYIKQKFDDRLSDYKRLNSYLSHEQKNAIAILRTNLELSNNTDYLKNLDYISNSIDDILILSENAEMSPLLPVDIVLVCAEVCDSYKNVSTNINFHFEESEDTEILARSRWIYRAVANLLDNAIKYGQDKPIFVSVLSKKGSVIIIVQDNGIGINKQDQEEIFNNRFRVNELNKDGYGIGLSLVCHVCDLCGGFVMLDSKPGKGTTFYLSFPQS